MLLFFHLQFLITLFLFILYLLIYLIREFSSFNYFNLIYLLRDRDSDLILSTLYTTLDI